MKMKNIVEDLYLQELMKTSTDFDLVHSDFWLTVRMNEEELNWTLTTVHQILTNELGMRKICAEMVPKNPLQEQKDIRRKRFLDFLISIENDAISRMCCYW